MTNISEILHPTRIKILKILSEKSNSLKNIAKNLDISKPEASRHVSKLRDLMLVEKDGSLNRLTHLGKLFITILGPIDFLIQHYKFFIEHPLINFPSNFLYGLKYFQGSELITGTGFIFQKEREYAQIAPKTMKLMINTPIPNFTGIIFEEGQFIVPLNTLDTLNNPDVLSKDVKKYEFRKYHEINYSIFILGDMFGFINFPTKNGLPDINSCFFITSKEGMTFLLSLWDYYWKKSTSFFQGP